MTGVNQDEREALVRGLEHRFGPGMEIYASISCDGCGFTVQRVRDPDGPLPRWTRTPDGRHYCPNCQ